MNNTLISLNDDSAFELVSGLWKGISQPLRPSAVLRSTNFRGDGLFDYGDVAEVEVEDRHFQARRLTPGDIVVERSGGGPKQPVGRVALFDPPDAREYCTSNFTTAIRIRDWETFDPTFVSLFLHGLYLRGATESLQRATTGIRNLDWGEYLRFGVPQIPITLQRSTASFVVQIREGYSREDRILSVLQDLKRAATRLLFRRGLRGEAQRESEIGPVPESWEVVEFSSVREWLQYGTSTRCTYEPTDFPVLRIPNIEPGRVNTKDIKFGSLRSDEVERYRLEKGDLIFIRTNGVIERLGACAVYAGEPERALFASYLIRARLMLDHINPFFTSYFFASELGTSIVAGRATPAADGKYNLNTGTMDSLPIPLPPTLDEQQEIVAVLDAIDRKIDVHRRKRAVLDELFKALLHKLMTGEIRVADLDLSALSTRDTAA